MQLSGATLCALCLGAHDRRFTRLRSDSGPQTRLHESFHCCVALRKCEPVGARPLHLAAARPFGHLKAPLGLSLFRFAPQTRSYRSDIYFCISSEVNFLTCVFAYSLYSSIIKTGFIFSQVFPLFFFRYNSKSLLSANILYESLPFSLFSS